jgi:hypothetical protein
MIKDGEIYCDDAECDVVIPDVNRRMLAGLHGWYFSKDGVAFCPTHIPSWLKKWREKRDG